MPSRLLMTVAVKGPPVLLRSNHDAVTANVTNMGPTEQAGLMGWRAGVGDREEIARERRRAKESEGERRRARESEGSGREK
jgi:hypothetical protein